MIDTAQVGRREELVRLSDDLLALLHNVPIFASLDGDKLHCLDGTRMLYLETGDVLVHQNENVRLFWILLSGMLKASQAGSDGRDIPMHNLTQGFAFGEVPLLANMPHAVTITAMESSQFLRRRNRASRSTRLRKVISRPSTKTHWTNVPSRQTNVLRSGISRSKGK